MATAAESAKAYGDRILEELEEIREAIMAAGETEDTPESHIVRSVQRADASGAGAVDFDFGGPTTGNRWVVETFTVEVGTPAGAILRLYVNEIAPGNLIGILTADATVGAGASDLTEVTVPENQRIAARVTGAGANNRVTVGVQAREHLTQAGIKAQRIGQIA